MISEPMTDECIRRRHDACPGCDCECHEDCECQQDPEDVDDQLHARAHPTWVEGCHDCQDRADRIEQATR